MDNDHKEKVLFICTHNSARSQMAEGILRSFYGENYDVYSAGIDPVDVNPYAIKAMAEIGIDISHHRSKSLSEFEGVKFDYVVSVCEKDKESCPVFLDCKNFIHKEFENPGSFEGTGNERIEVFRKVRDRIITWIKATFH